jgi:hypothetical protein
MCRVTEVGKKRQSMGSCTRYTQGLGYGENTKDLGLKKDGDEEEGQSRCPQDGETSPLPEKSRRQGPVNTFRRSDCCDRREG